MDFGGVALFAQEIKEKYIFFFSLRMASALDYQIDNRSINRPFSFPFSIIALYASRPFLKSLTVC
jgi:hypothetical protein